MCALSHPVYMRSIAYCKCSKPLFTHSHILSEPTVATLRNQGVQVIRDLGKACRAAVNAVQQAEPRVYSSAFSSSSSSVFLAFLAAGFFFSACACVQERCQHCMLLLIVAALAHETTARQ